MPQTVKLDLKNKAGKNLEVSAWLRFDNIIVIELNGHGEQRDILPRLAVEHFPGMKPLPVQLEAELADKTVVRLFGQELTDHLIDQLRAMVSRA